MISDPTRELLVAALRRLRRAPGAFNKQRVAADDALREWIGEGDLDQAWSVLAGLVERHQHDLDGDIHAYFTTCGWTMPGDTLDARLKGYAAKHHVDERTALRRSDRGAIKLAQVLRDHLLYDRPLARIYVYQDGSNVRSWVDVYIEKNGDWRRPRVYVNGQRLEQLTFNLNPSRHMTGYLSCSEPLPELKLDLATGKFEPLLSIRVIWAMPIWPAWDLTSHMVDERLFSRLTVDKEGSAEVRLYWFGDQAFESRGEPLKKAATAKTWRT